MDEKGPEENNDVKGSQVKKSQNGNENENNRSNVTNAGEQEIVQQKFYYLEQKEGEDVSIFNGDSKNDDENIFKPHAILNKYAICILLKEDGTEDSNLLKLTLDGIISNFGGLTELGIGIVGKCEKLEEIHVPASLTAEGCDFGNMGLSYCPNVVIYTPAGSDMEAWANENGFKVVNE